MWSAGSPEGSVQSGRVASPIVKSKSCVCSHVAGATRRSPEGSAFLRARLNITSFTFTKRSSETAAPERLYSPPSTACSTRPDPSQRALLALHTARIAAMNNTRARDVDRDVLARRKLLHAE